MSEALTGKQMSSVLSTVLTAVMDNTARSEQKDAGQIGFSDLGFCQNKAVLTIRQTPPSDERKQLWKAIVGAALHDYIEKAFGQVWEDWLIEYGRDDGNEVLVAKFANGAEVPGTPDIIAPEMNSILELKSKDGFATVKRQGIPRNHRFQTYAGALAAIQRGLIDGSKPVHLYWVYLDRSGEEAEPWVEHEEYDPKVLEEIVEWIDDVIYARTNEEEGAKEIPASVCINICEHFGNCRGSLPVGDPKVITDEAQLNAIEMHLEGKQLEKDGKEMVKAARKHLLGVNGSNGSHQVRTTFIPESDVAATRRASYEKLEVVPVRRSK